MPLVKTSGDSRPLTIVTGANGGMGRSCARLFGAQSDLLLTDAAAEVEDFAAELTGEGYVVAGTLVGKLGDDGLLGQLATIARTYGGFQALLHTCGLGPSAPWQDVMQVNYVVTIRLLDQLRPLARNGTVAILIASVAAYMAPANDAIDELLDAPFAADLFSRLEPLLMEQAGEAGGTDPSFVSYALAKRRVLELCESGARDWAASGARIVSISPGMVYTNMGRHEAEVDPGAERAVKASPLGYCHGNCPYRAVSGQPRRGFHYRQ